jgi:hypothetical protein
MTDDFFGILILNKNVMGYDRIREHKKKASDTEQNYRFNYRIKKVKGMAYTGTTDITVSVL